MYNNKHLICVSEALKWYVRFVHFNDLLSDSYNVILCLA